MVQVCFVSELFVWTDDENWIIAESASEAIILYAELLGYDDLALYQRETGDMPANWKALPSEKLLSIHIEDGEGEEGVDEKGNLKQSARKWVEDNGKGFLAGRDY